MGNIIKLSVVLALICVVAAGALAFTEGITTPVIEKRQADELAENLKVYVPDADNFEEEIKDGKTFYVASKGGQDIAYIMPASKGPGYGGDVVLDVATDIEGNVIALKIIALSETPGLGDKVQNPDFLQQYVGKGLSDSLAVGDDIDGISGATVSSRAVTTAVKNAVEEIAAAFLGVAKAEWNLGAVEDGVYEGKAAGFGGDITVEVTVSGSQITAVEVLDHGETPGISDPAFAAVPQNIIDAQDYDVDAVSGATMSSNGIKQAVFNAIAR
ncbi:MAG: RnfABCDGE type electron transport complex subunit G [Candidatus Contubernalis sp.]|nr:RnfABCDGE type electron transport complex subunit G [Candidatus Contubernalis sp.]